MDIWASRESGHSWSSWRHWQLCGSKRVYICFAYIWCDLHYSYWHDHLPIHSYKITWSSLARATTSSKFALLSCYKDSNAKWLVLWEILKFYRKKQLNIIKKIRNNKNWKFSHLLLIPLIKLSKQQEFHPPLAQWSKRWLTSRVLPSGAMSLSWKHHQSTPSLFMNSKLAFTVICIKNFAGKKVHIISTVK